MNTRSEMQTVSFFFPERVRAKAEGERAAWRPFIEYGKKKRKEEETLVARRVLAAWCCSPSRAESFISQRGLKRLTALPNFKEHEQGADSARKNRKHMRQYDDT